jgi:4-amino-4-deoxy-L-arabinose transferase-like glycosyltransferase
VTVEATSVRARPRAPGWPGILRSPLLFVGAVTLAAAAFRLYQIGATHTNPFYDAAVRSMGQSWHNFFFGAYEPSGSVSVDKPPLDLWLQVASTKVFGFNSAALIVPQALAATAAVPLLYDLVRRFFGRAAGIAAAVALAVMPVAVVTARSDTMDSLMMALSLLAAWLVVRAIERREARWLYAAGVVAGLNFEVKLFEALAAVPAMAVLYLLAAHEPVRRRLVQLVAAGAAFLVAALWWPLAVSLSSGSKPFPIGSTNGSIWNVIFVYNGTARVHSGSIASGPQAPGPTRLFGFHLSLYGDYVGIELLAALVLGALALLVLVRRPLAADRGKRAFLAFIALWLLPSALLFSRVGILHLRYLEAISPPIAATIGIALVALVTAASRHRLPAVAIVAGLVAVLLYASHMPSHGAPDHEIALAAAIAAGLLLAAAAGRGERFKPALVAAGALALVALIASPTAKSVVVADKGQSDSGRPGYMPAAELASLTRYLASHTARDRYEVASAFYATAGPVIAHDGRPVLVLSTVNRGTLAPVTQLAQAVRRREVHYILFVGSCGTDPLTALGRCPATWRWARTHSVDVSKQAGLPRHGVLFRFT